ncbi:tetratricopeptide repeat protein [Candidatus Magnetomonas plexicatena]|uniref:tetratricopeptide repeat protein n=1 Tax=Candidatus Magnetomonas plexicatena TaxID=2552947 RepID=UPI001C74CE3F|nr:tetratricopeptide repeat protein [Nitrospirales bacterium LBB_01]
MISIKTIHKNYFNALLAMCLLVLTITVFYPSLGNDFVRYDDPKYVTGNPNVLKGLTVENVKWALTAHVDSNWFPVTLISHMLDVSMFGINPRRHHLTSLCLHCANTILVFFLFLCLTKSSPQAFVIAALFAVHPLRVESVAWISERKDVLSAFFFFLSLLFYVRYSASKRALYYFFAFFAFALSLTCKPMGVTLPFLALLLDFWPLRRFTNSAKSLISLTVEKLPFLMLSVISCVITIHVQKEGGSITHLPVSTAFMNAIISYVKYIYKMFIPINLCALYPLPEAVNPSVFAAALTLLIVISVICVLLIKTHPYFFTGWFWYVGTLVPAVGFVQVGVQAMADRYSYIPQLGLLLIIVMAFPAVEPSRKFLGKLYPVITAVVLVLLSVITINQSRYWKNSKALFDRAISVTENNQVMFVNLGVYLAETGTVTEGVAALKKAIAINPRFLQAHINLGTILLFQLNDVAGAKDEFSRALQISPENAAAFNGLGVAYAYMGDVDKAIELLQKAVKLAPDMEMARKNLYSAYLLKEKMSEGK